MMHYPDRYGAYHLDADKLDKASSDIPHVTHAKPPSDKLIQVYLELARLCSPQGYMAFLRPRLESLAGSAKDLPVVKDKEAWKHAVLELAVCDRDGLLCVAVVKGRTKDSLIKDMSMLRVPYRKLTGMQTPDDEAANLLKVALQDDCGLRGSMSNSQLMTARYLSRFLNIAESTSRKDVQDLRSLKLSAKEIDEVAHYVRTRHHFLANEVPLSTIVKPNEALLSEASVNFIRLSSVDAVIYSSRPTPMPVLAVEFDGHESHKKPDGIARDRLKTSLLAALGIPLLRISGEDSKFLSWAKANDEQKQQISTYFSAVGTLVRWLVRDTVRERREILQQNAEDSRLRQMLDELSVVFGKPFVELTTEQQNEILTSETLDECRWQEQVDGGMPIETQPQPTAIESLRIEISKLGVSEDCVRNYVLRHSGAGVQPVVQIMLPSGKTRYVEGPIVTIRLSAKPEHFINSPVLFGFQSLMAAKINLVLNPET